MELNVQRYLRAGGTPESLEKDLGIEHRRHGIHNNLVLLKYSQIESPMDHPIVQECRGIILDQDDNWNIVAFGFKKFFNFGEPLAEEIDWSTACVQEKVDGSMILLYFYKGEWHVATTGTPDANTEINGSGMTFSQLFWDTVDMGFLVASLNTEAQHYNFMFELTSVYNRVVVDHKETSLTLLGARRVDTWEEVHPQTELIEKLGTRQTVSDLFRAPGTFGHPNPNVGVKLVQEYPLQSMEACWEVVKGMDPLKHEGIVILWHKPNGEIGRNKCKNPGYVILHHAKDNITASIKNMVNVVRNNEQAEYLASFPDLLRRMDEIKIRYLELVTHLQECYIQHAHIPVQKEFAQAILMPGVCRHTGALFALRSGRVKSVREHLAKINLNNLLVLLGYKDK